MNQNDKNRLRDFYVKAIEKNGIGTPESVHWNSTHTQEIRFKILSQVADLNNLDILDLGCGHGDFLKYLISQEIKFRSFTGLDTVKEYIEFSKYNYKEIPNTFFSEINFLESDIPEADYVFCSGGMTFPIENGYQEYTNLIKKIYSKAKGGVAFNMLKKEMHTDNESFLTYDPAEIKKFCEGFANKVVLVENYLNYDFTIYLYK